MKDEQERPEFWERAFVDKQTMWGFEPAQSALMARDFFVVHGVKEVLVPGIGYGRNAKVFLDSGMAVRGIEISQTAIELAHRHFGEDLVISHGSVTEMPFDGRRYDGIFCYGLIHLLDVEERRKLIADCYGQLAVGGCMVFTMITKGAATYGQGELVGKDRYAQFGGVRVYFYDREAVEAEFGGYGMVEVREVGEGYPFWWVGCVKGGD